MTNYRRYKEGSTYFFTVVTYKRRKILCFEDSRKVLRDVIQEVQFRFPFVVEAWVLLPEHLHSIWTLPDGDHDYSKRWGLIKKGFTQRIKSQLHDEESMTESRRKKRECTIWQRRFWEHQIRDQEDFNRHCEYIHNNPVKHGLVESPQNWRYSTIYEYIREGKYHVGSSINNDVVALEYE